MNTYEDLLQTRQLTLISIPAAQYLSQLVASRLSVYALHLDNNPPSFPSAVQFLESEVLVLQNIREYLHSYLHKHNVAVEVGVEVQHDEL